MPAVMAMRSARGPSDPMEEIRKNGATQMERAAPSND